MCQTLTIIILLLIVIVIVIVTIIVIVVIIIISLHVKACFLNRHLSLTSTPIDYLKGRKFLEFRQVDCLKGPYICTNIE